MHLNFCERYQIEGFPELIEYRRSNLFYMCVYKILKNSVRCTRKSEIELNSVPTSHEDGRKYIAKST